MRETFDLKRKAAQAAIRILEIQRDRTQQTMTHAQANADLMQIHSPLDGVVVLNTIWKQGTMGEVQEGDQVRPGVPFMQVVNPADDAGASAGQPAGLPCPAGRADGEGAAGRVSGDGVSGEDGSDRSHRRRRGLFAQDANFVVIVAIEGNDPKLMPDLSAAVDVDFDEAERGIELRAGSGSGS